jgi:hypothetical protein
VDGPVGEAERAGRLPGGADGSRQDRAGQPGGGDEQGFLEGGAVGRGGLIEDAGDGQAITGQQAVDAQLRPGQVFLDEQGFGVGPPGGGEDPPDPRGRGHRCGPPRG